MSVYRDTSRGAVQWRYRKVVKLRDGTKVRISGTPDINTKAEAGDAERAHIERTINPPLKVVEASRTPTVADFKIDFMKSHVAANNKPSERIAKECMFRVHILPAFGEKRLDEISNLDVEAFKAAKLAGDKDGKGKLSPKSVNNLLTCLGKMLRYAADNDRLERVPRIRFVKVMSPPFDFLEHVELGRLVEAARTEPEALAAILLGADAGLRQGEIRALQWGDLDLKAGRITVQRNEYRGHLGSPKGGRARRIPMTTRLQAALKAARHLRGEWVFSDAKGVLWTRCEADTVLRKARKRAGLRSIGWHVLRHTFCSHLAMRGVPVRTIQELAGHASITTTMRYMHLTESAVDDAIRLLEGCRAS